MHTRALGVLLGLEVLQGGLSLRRWLARAGSGVTCPLTRLNARGSAVHHSSRNPQAFCTVRLRASVRGLLAMLLG